MNPIKLTAMRQEVEYMLQNGIIKQSQSQWSSPCVLVPKPDGSYRFCPDFRQINAVTKSDSYPIPRVDNCIDQIGHTQYISKLDLLKGYWQVALTERATDLSICDTWRIVSIYGNAIWDEKCPSHIPANDKYHGFRFARLWCIYRWPCIIQW